MKEGSNMDEYEMPDSSESEKLEKPEENSGEVQGLTVEQMEDQIRAEQEFLTSLDIVSHKEEFLSEEDYIQKLLEIEELGKGDPDSIDNKIYKQSIINLIDYHEKALKMSGEKWSENIIGWSEGIQNKSDEISERRTILKRHLYDLEQNVGL